MSDAERSLRRYTLLMVLLQSISTPMMLSAVNVAVPGIADDLGMDAVSLSWIPMSYLTASAMFILIFGRLADRYGRKRLFLTGTMGVILSSLFAACAPDGSLLLTGRFLQGICAAMLYATQVALISSVFPAAERGRVIGMTVSFVYLGLSAGPLLGGLLVDQFGWRAAFLVHIPMTLVVFLLGIWRVPGEWAAAHQQYYDVQGTLLYVLSIALVCGGVSLLPTSSGGLLVLSGILLMVLFVRCERRVAQPLLDVRLFFTSRLFTRSCAAAWLHYTATYANVVLIALYLYYFKGMTASLAGLVILAQPLTMSVVSQISGRLSTRIEPRLLASSGLVVSCLGLILLSRLQVDSAVSHVVAGLLLTGIGISLFVPPNSTAIMNSVESGMLGLASAAVSTVRILGQMGSMGLVTVMLALFVGKVELTPEHYDALLQAICTCFGVAALLILPALYCSLRRGRVLG